MAKKKRAALKMGANAALCREGTFSLAKATPKTGKKKMGTFGKGCAKKKR